MGKNREGLVSFITDVGEGPIFKYVTNKLEK